MQKYAQEEEGDLKKKLADLKQVGNELFRKNSFAEALEKFSEGAQKIQQNYQKDRLKGSHSEILKLYV